MIIITIVKIMTRMMIMLKKMIMMKKMMVMKMRRPVAPEDDSLPPAAGLVP